MIRRVDSADVAYQAEFLVDTGATDSMAPTSELERIGITRVGHKTYEAGGRSEARIRVRVGADRAHGRGDSGGVLFGPDGIEPLLGVTALESMGITIDPASGTLRRLPAIPLKPLPATDDRRRHARGQRAAVTSSGIRSTFTVSCTAGE
jgi:predicted aspartyl protease